APWMLCAVEVLIVLLIYFMATSRSLVIHHHRFSFTRSLEDIVGLSCTRAAVLSLAYAVGQRSVHRPYLYAAYLLAIACIPYIAMKTMLFRYGSDKVAAAAILVITGLSSACHVLAARRTVDWARRRYQMGLAGFGMPWEEGEDAWLAMRRPDLEDLTKTSDGGGPDASDDVPAEMLADDDSKFLELEPGLKVHYKEVAPPSTAATIAASPFGGPDGATTGIVLVHGFGGGVFSWRHIMEALAMQCHCRVIAFDRPAFGLTSRPKATEQNNPYTVSSQSQLLLQLCSALRLRQVVLMAHADGCLVTLRAAATSASFYQQRGMYLHPQQLMAPQLPAYEIPHYMTSTFSVALKAPERARTAPSSSSSDDSPKLMPEAPGSPPPEQLLSSCHHAQLLPAGSGQVSLLPQALSSGGGGGGGALSAAAFAAAGSGDLVLPAPGVPSHQVSSASSGPVILVAEPEVCRSVVAAEEVARAGGSAHQGGMAQVSAGARGRREWPMPRVLGLVLLHPNLSGVMGPTFFRILARSKLGRSILRPLLRSEVGEVANRRAWHNTDKLTSEVLELYKTPLRVEGWDAALIETTRQRRESCQGDLPSYCSSVESIPTLIATGEHDRIVPPSKSESLGTELPHAHLAVLHDCGHLSHEEAPTALLEHLVPFCGEVLCHSYTYAAGGRPHMTWAPYVAVCLAPGTSLLRAC
ncbi:hypothetical protein VOLCADRAFT_118552, partial [Volvox carteri f. nagariensis]